MSRALWKRLGYRARSRVHLDEAPAGYAALVAGHPKGVRFVGLGESPTLVHHFTTEAEGLAARLAVFSDALAPRGAIGVSWPKASSGVATTVTGEGVAAAAAHLGLARTKVCAVDAVWTAQKLKAAR